MDTPLDEKMLQWEELEAEVNFADILQSALQNAASGLSEMVGRPITIDTPRAEAIPLGKVPDCVGGPETEMVGVYLLIDGDLTGQVILMLPLDDALHLIDLLLGEPSGTTTELDDLGRSALAETGNLTASYFLNKIASLTGLSIRPSPPAVMVDMMGAIFNVIASPLAAMSDKLTIVETAFQEPERTVTAHFWVLPYPVHSHHQ
jgi:chemotaxis protein CheC